MEKVVCNKCDHPAESARDMVCEGVCLYILRGMTFLVAPANGPSYYASWDEVADEGHDYDDALHLINGKNLITSMYGLSVAIRYSHRKSRSNFMRRLQGGNWYYYGCP